LLGVATGGIHDRVVDFGEGSIWRCRETPGRRTAAHHG
jgi:hypothetical protein